MGKPNMEIRIVPLERRHISILAELEQVCFADPWSENALIEELENPQAVFLTAENLRGEVLGYAGMHNILGEGYIDNIAVFPQMQGKGIGSELVNALLNYGNRMGSYLSLWKSAPPMRPLYHCIESTGSSRRGFGGDITAIPQKMHGF